MNEDKRKALEIWGEAEKIIMKRILTVSSKTKIHQCVACPGHMQPTEAAAALSTSSEECHGAVAEDDVLNCDLLLLGALSIGSCTVMLCPRCVS